MTRGARRLSRVGQYVAVIAVAATVNFALPRLAGGDPVDFLLGSESSSLSPAQRAQLIEDFGLDGSVLEQFVRYVANLVQGDFGWSIVQGRPVVDVVLERIPWTLVLTGTAVVCSALVGVGVALVAVSRRGGRTDVGLVAGMLAIGSLPGFWIAMVLIAVFAAGLGWFPSFGATPAAGLSSGLAGVAEIAQRLVLPVATVTLVTVGETFLLARGALVAALAHPSVGLAEAKGVAASRVLLRHALPNALLPVLTRVTVLVGLLVTGSVVVEGVFSYPGLGQLLYQSVLARDYPVLQGGFLFIAVSVVLINLAADAAYPLLDPRVRSGAR